MKKLFFIFGLFLFFFSTQQLHANPWTCTSSEIGSVRVTGSWPALIPGANVGYIEIITENPIESQTEPFSSDKLIIPSDNKSAPYFFAAAVTAKKKRQPLSFCLNGTIPFNMQNPDERAWRVVNATAPY